MNFSIIFQKTLDTMQQVVYAGFMSNTQTKQPTVREINAHLASMTKYCYVYDAAGTCLMRISRARSRKGVLEGHVIGHTGPDWAAIPADAHIKLADY